jgi:hypothetical protein
MALRNRSSRPQRRAVEDQIDMSMKARMRPQLPIDTEAACLSSAEPGFQSLKINVIQAMLIAALFRPRSATS